MKKYQVAIIGTNIGAKHFEDFQKISNRTETACSQKLTYLSMELAIKAQEQAENK